MSSINSWDTFGGYHMFSSPVVRMWEPLAAEPLDPPTFAYLTDLGAEEILYYDITIVEDTKLFYLDTMKKAVGLLDRAAANGHGTTWPPLVPTPGPIVDPTEVGQAHAPIVISSDSDSNEDAMSEPSVNGPQ
ncbi:hypothetical protein U1Q18_024553 [Sarracenia purpurea var. burkii]